MTSSATNRRGAGLAARCIVITGAAGKIGRLLTAHFLAQGDSVVAIGRRRETLDALGAEHADAGRRLILEAADLASEGACPEIAERLARKGISATALVNGARALDHLAVDDRGRVSRANFSGELLLAAVVPYELTHALLDAGAPLEAVVNIGSMYGVVAANPSLYENPEKQSPLQYGVAKAALVHLTKELAVRLAPRGVRVNCVSFGGVKGRVDDAFIARYAALNPQRRMLSEDDVVGPVDFLLSEQSRSVTGHNLLVDGGWTVW